MTTKPIPEGYSSVTPYLAVSNASAAIDFYKRAFGAEELFRMDQPGGKVGHAEIKIGDSRVMLADEYPDIDFIGPAARGGSSVLMHLYVDDVDATFQQAIDAGAKETRPVKNEFYGDRSGTLEDPFGHKWSISTHVEDVDPETIAERAKEISAEATASPAS